MKQNRAQHAISILEHAKATGMCSPMLEHIGIDLLIAALEVADADADLVFADAVGDPNGEPSRRLDKWRTAYRAEVPLEELSEDDIRASLAKGWRAMKGKSR